MSNFVKKGFVLLLVVCMLLGIFVPGVAAAATTDPVVYDFYATKYAQQEYEAGKKYSQLYHSSNTTPQSLIANDFANGDSNWKVELGSGYANFTKPNNKDGYLSMFMGVGAYAAFRFKSPGYGNYNVAVNYVQSNKTNSKGVFEANAAAEFLIIPAEKAYYTAQELTNLADQYRYQLRVSCYTESAYQQASGTIAYSFEEGKEYLFVVRGGPCYGDPSTYGATYLRGITATRVGDYNPAPENEYARPITALDEALTRWEDDYSIVAKVNGENYFALPIYGGKMYIFNLDTWQLIDEVNTGIDVPRGIAVDDDGVIYLVGTSYSIYMYDLKTYTAQLSSQFTGSGVSAGSAYDIHCGEDGKLYFGTDNGHIICYDPDTDSHTIIAHGLANATYVSTVVQQGQYIYAAVTTSASKHYIVKIEIGENNTYRVVGKVDYTSTGPATYISHISITADGIIFGSAKDFMAIDTAAMVNVVDPATQTFSTGLMKLEDFGVDSATTPKDENGYPYIGVQCYVSEELNGKYYYVGKDRWLYCYDPNATGAKLMKVSTGSMGQFLDCQGKGITLDRDGDNVEETYWLAIENPKDNPITFISVQNINGKDTVKTWQGRLPLDANAGAGTGVNSLTNGPAGSNELYYGGFTSNQVIIYNTAEGEITGSLTGAGIQTDAIYVDGDTIYAGNYTEAQLTRLHRDTNKPEVLMTLHNSLFNQSRIHAITGGDNKIFFGTFPYVYKHGGVLAWYDLTTNRSYVAVGPNPTDVYYANYEDTQYDYTVKNPTIPVSSVRWYNEVTGEQLTGFDEWTGIVDYQGIKDVTYYNGILYAATSRAGGTNTNPIAEESAMIIAYDVTNRRIIATFDPSDYGFATPAPAISGIKVDENGTLWGLVSETLFTLTLNDNGTFTYVEKLSFDKFSYDATQDRVNSSIVFDGKGYVYVAFERIGGICKINVNDTSDYEMLLPNVTSNRQVPESLALGEDGNLYYLLGTALKMLPINSTGDEWAAAKVITEQIDAITEDSALEEIEAIRAAYDALTAREKSLVQNYAALEKAEVDALIRGVDNLGDITWAKYDQVKALLATYQQMPKAQQNKVTNYYALSGANRILLALESEAPVVVTNKTGDKAYFDKLEDALAATTEGTISLRGDVTATAVSVKSGVVLDLNGYTLIADSVAGNVVDSADGKGLIKVSPENAALVTKNDQLALWDNTTENPGYRLFNYKFANIGMDANKNRDKSDASMTAQLGTTVKSFWCDLSFTNSYAYTLVSSGNSTLEVGFEVTWKAEGEAAADATFAFDAKILRDWAIAEEGNTGDKNYCFYISLQGFDALKKAGVAEVKPYIKTAFNSDCASATEYEYTNTAFVSGLECELGFDKLTSAAR